MLPHDEVQYVTPFAHKEQTNFVASPSDTLSGKPPFGQASMARSIKVSNAQKRETAANSAPCATGFGLPEA